jgi:hypothetical protein
MEDVVAVHPFRVGRAEIGSGPHAQHFRFELEGKIQRANGFDFEKDNRPGGSTASRHEHTLADGEGRVRVSDGGEAGRHFDGRSVGLDVDRHRIIGKLRLDVEAAQNLHREHPALEYAALFAQNRAAFTRNRERLRPLHGARDDERIAVNGEPGDGF